MFTNSIIIFQLAWCSAAFANVINFTSKALFRFIEQLYHSFIATLLQSRSHYFDQIGVVPANRGARIYFLVS